MIKYLATPEQEAIQRVRDLHKPFVSIYGDGFTYCEACCNNYYSILYPCDTIKALDGTA